MQFMGLLRKSSEVGWLIMVDILIQSETRLQRVLRTNEMGEAG